MRWLSMIVVFAFSPSMASAELLFHLKLDDGQADPNATIAVDSSPNGNDGLLEGFSSPPPWTTGVAGGALTFTNSGDRVRIGSVGAATPTGADPRTVAMWINPDLMGDRKFFSYGAGGAGNSFDFTVESVGSTGPSIRFRHGGGNMAYPLGFDPIDQWIHVAAVVPEGASQVQDLELYINGSLTAFDPATANNPTAAMGFPLSDIFLGSRFTGGNPFVGQIDDVQFYDTALNAEDVGFLFDNPGQALGAAQVIPEPVSSAIFGLSVAGLLLARRRRSK